MKIGYPCINNSISRKTASTFRLASYSESRMIQTIKDNLIHLNQILKYNVKNDLLFFRISSDLIPFASHPICKLAWHNFFQYELEQIGDYIKKYNIRISMYPDQFVVLNSPNEKTVQNSIRELNYHCKLLDTMCLDETAKVQIHVGGVYGNKSKAIDRFIKKYNLVDHSIKKRLVIENDDHLYSLKDCICINKQTGIPVVFDRFHHECFGSNNNNKDTGELKSENSTLQNILQNAFLTWKINKDGLPMVDYSSQDVGTINHHNQMIARRGKHTLIIDPISFEKFLKETESLGFDIMLEIKDKEKSALKALEIMRR
jgi:UV DNA damage endonuclease